MALHPLLKFYCGSPSSVLSYCHLKLKLGVLPIGYTVAMVTFFCTTAISTAAESEPIVKFI